MDMTEQVFDRSSFTKNRERMLEHEVTARCFRLADTHPLAIDGAAKWLTGDPGTDIEGDPRPMTNDTPDFAGADVVVP